MHHALFLLLVVVIIALVWAWIKIQMRRRYRAISQAVARLPKSEQLDDRFHESCHNGGIHLDSRTPI